MTYLILPEELPASHSSHSIYTVELLHLLDCIQEDEWNCISNSFLYSQSHTVGNLYLKQDCD